MKGNSPPTLSNEGNALVIDLSLSAGVVAMAPIRPAASEQKLFKLWPFQSLLKFRFHPHGYTTNNPPTNHNNGILGELLL